MGLRKGQFKHTPRIPNVFKYLQILVLFPLAGILGLWSCGGQQASFNAVNQAQVTLNFGTGTTSAANTALSTTSLTVGAVCNGVSFPNTTVQGGNSMPLALGTSCTLTLRSFTIPSSQEVFTASTPAIAGSTITTGTYTGSLGNQATITPSVVSGSLDPLTATPSVLFTYQSSNTVVAGLESNYSYLGVVNGQTGTFQVTFTTTTGTATNLALSTSGLPATWSVSSTTCSNVTTGAACRLTLSFAPVSVNASQQTLTVPYTYTTPDGGSHSSSFTLGYQGLNRLKWSYTTGGNVTSTPIYSASGSTIYATSSDAKLYALNSSTGSVNWSYTAGSGIQGNPTLSADGSTIFFAANDGKAYAVNTSNGSQKWVSSSCGNSFYASGILNAAESVFYGTCYGVNKIYAFSASTGASLWSSAASTTGNSTSAAPSADGAYIYFSGNANNILQYSTASQTQTGSYNAGQLMGSTPTISADGTTLYIGGFSATASLFALNIPAMTLKWSSAATGANIFGDPLLTANQAYVYAVSGDGYFYKFATAQTNGATNVPWVLKSSTSYGSTKATPYLSPDETTLYVQGATAMYAFNTTTAAVNWTYNIGSACQWWDSGGMRPSRDGSTVYSGCWADQKIYAFNESVIKR